MKMRSVGSILNQLAIITVLIVTILQGVSEGGGIHILEDSVFFNDSKGTVFQAKEPINFKFTYDGFVYAGQPIIYAIFEVYSVANTNEKKLEGLFGVRLSRHRKKCSGQFYLPKSGQEYEIKYHVVPYFSNTEFSSEAAFLGGYLSKTDINKVSAFYKNNYNGTEKIATLSTRIKEHEFLDDGVTLYFKDTEKIKTSIANGSPLNFKWFVGSESSKSAKNIRYSYRLDPIEDWTILSEADEATYDFLKPGNYTFQVKAAYTQNGVAKETNIASWEFRLDKQIFEISSKGIIDKIPSGPASQTVTNKIKSHRNLALLVGVENYKESTTFKKLPIQNDIKAMKRTLEKLNFQVEVIDSNTTKINIVNKMNEFAQSCMKGDRIVFYFTGHGTSQGEAAFLVPSDGKSSDKMQTCIPFSFIEKWIKTLMEKREVNQLLILLDSCQSGLGVLSKSGARSSLLELATYPSAHMMTAGLMGQDAQMDLQTQTSVFTSYIEKGLTGGADYNKDGIITLTELLLYVQENVSKYVEEKYSLRQTPVMGKIKGAGEMLFLR